MISVIGMMLFLAGAVTSDFKQTDARREVICTVAMFIGVILFVASFMANGVSA